MAIRTINGNRYVDFRYIVPETGGRDRFRRSVGKISRKAAEKLEREYRVALERGEDVLLPGDAAFSGMAVEYLAKKVQPDLKPSTYRSYEQILRVHAVPHFGDVLMREVRTKDIADYKAAMLRKLSPHTVCNHLGVLSRMFETAIAWGYARKNPVKGVGMPRVEREPRPTWSLDEINRFLEAVELDSPRHAMLFRLAAFSGMRQGELLVLRWDDVDLERGVVHVRHTLSAKQVTKTKNGKPRYVPLSPETIERLRQHPRHMRSKLVFYRDDGSHMSGHQLRRPMDRATEAAGLDRIRFHDLRHSYASVLANQGTPPIVIQEILGHRCPEATAMYVHANKRTMRHYVGLLDSEAGREAQGRWPVS